MTIKKNASRNMAMDDAQSIKLNSSGTDKAIPEIDNDEDIYRFIDHFTADSPKVVKKYWKAYIDSIGTVILDDKLISQMTTANEYFKTHPQYRKSPNWDDPSKCVFRDTEEGDFLEAKIEQMLQDGATEEDVLKAEEPFKLASYVDWTMSEIFEEKSSD